MTLTPPGSNAQPAKTTTTSDNGGADSAKVRPVELVAALARVSSTTPERIVTRYRQRALCYRELSDVVNQLITVTRSQQMDDGAAVVAAIFARLPELATESDHEIVASVVSGALGRVWADFADVTGMSDSSAIGEKRDSDPMDEGDIGAPFAV
ncbi:UNVERIFIED_CONTAM: hypothetical protein DES50_1014 [Williamsia faeni]